MSINAFVSSGTYTPAPGVTSVDVLVVAGGGAGGSPNSAGSGGGGGAGGLIYSTAVAVTPGVPITVTVGAGGVAGAAGSGVQGGDGGNSVFGAITATGGGGGGSGSGANEAGRNGGSGGGSGGHDGAVGGPAPGNGVVGQGNNGGYSYNANFGNNAGGGGGGAGGVGAPGPSGAGAAGGVGANYATAFGTFFGVGGWFAGGGASGVHNGTWTAGGVGGGGNGAASFGNVPATAGSSGSGGGGGGGMATLPGKDGGSGVVIVVAPRTAYSTEVLADAPLAYWRLGETSGTTAVDSSGNSRPATYAATKAAALGLLPGDPDWSTYQKAAIASAAWMSVNDITVEAVIRFAAAGSNMGVVSRYTANDWLIWINGSGQIAVRFYNTGGAQVDLAWATAPTPNVIYHVTATYTSGSAKLYINGDVVASSTALTGNLKVSTNPIEIRSYNNANDFNGWIDEVAIYGTALSATRILAHVVAGFPALAWKNSGSLGGIWDMGAGTHVGTAPLPSGSAGTSVVLTGVNPVASAVMPALAATSNPQTVELWFAKQAAAVKGGLFKIGAQDGGGWGLGIGSSDMDNAGSNLLLLRESIAWYNLGAIATGIHHLVATRTGNTIQVYLDGVSVYNAAATINGTTAGTRMEFGGYRLSPTTGRLLDSTIRIDKCAFYTGILSAARVTAHYAAGVGSDAEVTTDAPLVLLDLDIPSLVEIPQMAVNLSAEVVQTAVVVDPTTVAPRLSTLVAQVALLALPATPTGVTAVGVSHTVINMSWSASLAATSYEVRLNGGAPTDVGNVLSTSFTGLTPLTSYTLEVRAKNANGLSSWVSVTASTLSVPSGYAAEVLSDTPLMWWRFNDQPSNPMLDSSGNNRHGLYTGVTASVAGLVTGDADTAMQFSGKRGEVYADTWMDGSFSIVATIKMTTGGLYQHIASRFSASSPYNGSSFVFRMEGSNKLALYIFVGNSFGNILSGTTLAVGTTYDVGCSYDAATGAMRLYVNGAPDGTGTQTGMNLSDLPLAIGGPPMNTNEVWNGVIDDVSFHGGVLTPTQIANLRAARISTGYTAAVMALAPRAYYRMSDASAVASIATIADSSGNSHNGNLAGTYTHSPSLLAGDPTGKSITLLTGEASIGSGAWMNVDFYSIECWFTPRGDYGSDGMWLIGRDVVGNASELDWRLSGNSTSVGVVMQKVGGAYVSAYASMTFVPGRPYHVVSTYDGTNIKTYVNGVLMATTNTPGVTIKNNTTIWMGSYGSGNANADFHGQIDEVAFYGYALSAGRIAQHYNAGITPPVTTPTGQVNLLSSGQPVKVLSTGQPLRVLG